MPDTDAPQVEPLTLTLEEALQRLYAKGLTLIPPGDDTDSWGIGVASDSPDEEFDTWHEAVSAVEGVPVVPRDDTAELIEALEGAVVHGERLLDSLSHPVFPGRPAFDGRVFKEHRDEAKEGLRVARAALARVKEQR